MNPACTASFTVHHRGRQTTPNGALNRRTLMDSSHGSFSFFFIKLFIILSWIVCFSVATGIKSQNISWCKFAPELDPCLELSNNVKHSLLGSSEFWKQRHRMKKGGCLWMFILLWYEVGSFAFKWTEKDWSINLGFIKSKHKPVHSLHSPQKSPLVKNKITSTNSWVCVMPCCLNTVVW